MPASGELSVQRLRPARHPQADCFYVYPTASRDPGVNSDFDWSPEEEGLATRHQAARFSSVCRVFVPVYRQITVTALADGRGLAPSAQETAYADVVDAWKHYVANDNHGRDVILLGHSQGSHLAGRLLREEIEPNRRLRSHLVAAYLIGNTVQVAEGSDTGGGYTTPICTRLLQTGCIVTYGTYRSTIPPGLLGLFGRDTGPWFELPRPGLVAACTNPAALLDGQARPDSTTWLRPYLPTRSLAGETLPPGPWVDPAFGTVTTPQVALPRFLEGRCVGRNGFHYLEVTVHGDPADPRVDDIGGDLEVPGVLTKDMSGLHSHDYALALGDLVRLAGLQAFVHSLL